MSPPVARLRTAETTSVDDLIRTGIVEDNGPFREALLDTLGGLPGIRVVGAAASAEMAVASLDGWDPHVVLMDLRMAGMGGVEGTRAILRLRPDVRVVVLTSCEDIESVRSALGAGAAGYLIKGSTLREIGDGILAAMSGRTVISAEVLPALV